MGDPVKQRQLIIQQLRDAKKAHRRWVSRAQIMMDGMPVAQEQLPLKDTECTFGIWYHGEGRLLSGYPEFARIHEPHKKLHDIYQQIFTLLVSEKKPSLFRRLLGRKARRSRKQQTEAKRLLAELNMASLEILDYIGRLEKVIHSLSDKEIERLAQLHEIRTLRGEGAPDPEMT
jgi:adenylate kinase family enzyme